MLINEIFFSIQGEGQLCGLPTVFIRTTGCNLRCNYCDTQYAYSEGKELGIDEIIRQVKRFPTRQVCITGGEPLLQKDLSSLMEQLIILHYEILIETNGSKEINQFLSEKKISLSVDIKCPSSGMQSKMMLANIKKLRSSDQLKFVIQTQNDFEFSCAILQKYRPNCQIFFQPVWGFDPKVLAKWILDRGITVRLGLQLHKIIWGETRKT